MTIAPGALPAHDARKLALELLAKAKTGGDPQGEKVTKRNHRSHVFRAVAKDFIADRTPKWRPGTARQYRHILLVYWKPLHGMELNAATRADIATGLRRIERERGTRSAALARARLWTLYYWAMGEGLIENNPVIGTTKIEYTGERKRVLSNEELAKVWRACSAPENFPRDGNFGRVVKLLILLGARRKEITGMTWSELDLPKGTWTLPAERSKNHRAHTLPLPPAAVAIFDEISRERWNGKTWAPDEYVFSTFGSMNVDRPKEKLYEQSGTQDWWLHDLRRSVATGMADIGIQPHVIECVLNHVSGFRGGVAGRYNLSPYKRDVKQALNLWSEHVLALAEDRPNKVAYLPPRAA